MVLWTAHPSAVTGYDDANPDLLAFSSGQSSYLRDSLGLIETNSYYTTTTATSTTAGGVAGYLDQTSIKRGELGTAIPQEKMQFISRTSGGITIYLTGTITRYRNDNGTGGLTVTYDYTWSGSSFGLGAVTITYPAVATNQNGDGNSPTESTAFDSMGYPIWFKDSKGILSYTAFDRLTGAATSSIRDVDTSVTADFTGLPSGWGTISGAGLHLKTTTEVDDLGRPTKQTNPAGVSSFTVYNDVNHEVRMYQGWDTTNLVPTGPTIVVRSDQANGYTESLAMTATPSVSSGRPTGTESISGIQAISRATVGPSGQVTSSDTYFNLSGLTYTTGSTLGTENTHFYRTNYGYDSRGRKSRVVSPLGTIYRTVIDGQGRLVSDWVGTDDTPTSGAWTPSNTAGTNLTKRAEYEYDGGDVGNWNLTKATSYPGGSLPNSVTDYYYDWRDHLVGIKDGVESSESTGTNRPITYYDFDNLNQITKVRSYDGDGITLTTTNGVPDSPSSSLLRAQTVYAYDDQGQNYKIETFSVDPSSGSISSTALTTQYWYDRLGNVIKQSNPGGLVWKTSYDGVGRITVDSTTDGGGDSGFSDADDVTGDVVFNQSEYAYGANGRVSKVTNRIRFHDETGTGALGTSTSGVKARVSYAGYYYDAAGRPTADVNVGTNGGSAWSLPTSVPSRSDSVLVTSYAYNAAGLLQDVTDPKGLITRTEYDPRGLVTKTIENYTNGTPTDTSNKTINHTYNGNGQPVTLSVSLPGGGSQTTEWVYGVSTGTGSAYTSNDALAGVKFPDPTTGSPSSTIKYSLTLSSLGQEITKSDRNGNVHTYSYDALGRMTSDAVTTLGSGVDGAVRRVEIGYDGQGNASLFTSYDAASGGTVVNQIKREFNGLGQLTSEWQSHSGSVSGSSPRVQYAYSEMAGGANHSRLTSMTYPNGKVLTFNYGSGLDSSISRLTSLSDTTGTLESFDYLGLSKVVRRGHSQPGIDQTAINLTGESNGDAGDKYTGLDRFGRVVDQRWVVAANGVAVDRFQYGYDRNSYRTYRDNLVNTAFGELYTYDGLNQMASFDRGTLNSGKTGLTGTASRTQSWDYDALGNWDSVTTNGTAQTRTHDKQNQITAVSGLTTPTYDAEGNLTKDQNGQQYVYDAWNILVRVKNSSGTTIAEYQSDGLGRRISESKGGTRTDLYYSDGWQVLEERVGSAVKSQYVWSQVYVDAMILRDRDTDANGTLDERLWAVQDANWNVTSLVNGSGAVVERYVYDSFGAVTVYDANWNVRSGGSSYGWNYLFQGLRHDTTTGLYQARNRDLHPTLGRTLQRDPIGFAAGDANVYRWEGNSTASVTDPMGLAWVPPPHITDSWTKEDWEAWENRPKSVPTYSIDVLQELTNGFAGFSDGATGGLTKHLRRWMGTADYVNEEGGVYQVLEVGGQIYVTFIPACHAGKLKHLAKGIEVSGQISSGIDFVEAAANGDVEGAIEAASGLVGQGGKSCFAAGTPICTPTGYRMIEELKVGDFVRTRDENEPESPTVDQPITDVFVRVAPIVILRIGGKELRTTAEHPFFAEGRGWIPAGMLEAGEKLLLEDGRWLPIEHVKDNGEVTTVYNFEVAEYHTYFVGDIGWWGFELWTHNQDCTPKGNTGPNGGKRNPADQKRIDEQRQRRADRRESESRAENGQNPRGHSTDHDSANRGPQGDRPKIEGGANRERNIGIDEEHSRVPKGSGGQARR